MFDPDEPRYVNGVLVQLPYLTNDEQLLTAWHWKQWGAVLSRGVQMKQDRSIADGAVSARRCDG
jgi:hypothetical protein